MKKRVLSPTGQRRLRMGRKAIACGRMQSAIEGRTGTKSTDNRRGFKLSYRPTRLHLVGMAIMVLVVGSGIGGYAMYERHQAKQRDIAEKARLEEARIASEKAAACRARVASTKTDQLGKITYAELYGTEC